MASDFVQTPPTHACRVHPKPRSFFPCYEQSMCGILRWVFRAVVGPDRPQSQKGTDNADVAPRQHHSPKESANQYTFYLLGIALLLRNRQVILLQDPSPKKGSARIPHQIKRPLGSPPNKGSASGAEKFRLIKGPQITPLIKGPLAAPIFLT